MSWCLDASFKKTIFKGKKLREHSNIKKIHGFINHDMGVVYDAKWKKWNPSNVDTNEQETMKRYLGLYKKNALQTSMFLHPHGWGRVQPTGYLSLAVMRRCTRHALCEGIYIDIDMVNSHPQIIREMCRVNGVPCPQIDNYIENRESILAFVMQTYGVSRDDAKTLPLQITYGGSYNGWFEDCGLNPMGPRIDVFNGFETEMAFIKELVFRDNPDIVKDVLKHKSDKWSSEYEKKNGVMGLWAQTMERRVQETAISYLVDKGFELEDIVPCQDGLMILKETWYPELIDDIEAEIFKHMKIQVHFKVKAFDEAMNIPEEEPIKDEPETKKLKVEENYVKTDLECAQEVISLLGDRLIFCAKAERVFYKDKHVWIPESNEMRGQLSLIIQESPLWLKHETRYVTNTTTAKRIVENVCALARKKSDTDYELFHSTTQHRLAFQDGVLDFMTREFTLWENITFPYFTTVCISYDYEEYFKNPNKEDMQWILDTVMEPLFGNDVERAMLFLSRALAGCIQDKNFATFQGNRNTGKGVLYDLLSGLQCYLKPLPFNNLICQRQTNMEISTRMLGWMMELEYARIAISQETPEPELKYKLNNSMMKKMVSGGDYQQARRNYDIRDSVFKLQVTPLFMGNHPVDMDPDVREHCFAFSTCVKFVSKEEYDSHPALQKDKYRVKDDTVKFKAGTKQFQMAMIHLLYESFKNEPISVKQEEEREVSAEEVFETDYVVTKNDNDVVTIDKLKEKFQSQFPILKKYIETKHNCKKIRFKSAPHRDKWGYKGIRERTDAEKDAIEEYKDTA